MENTQSRPSSPLSTSTTAQATTYLPPSTSPPLVTRTKRYSEPTTNRQKRLLQNRNAKFPAQKLSLSSIGSKFSQLIHANEEEQEHLTDGAQTTFVESKENATINPQGIFGEVTNSNRKSRKGGDFSIYQDTPERPLLQRSPYSSPSAYPDQSSELCSPFAFDHIQDSLVNMRLRQISGNELRSSPLVSSQLTGSVKAKKLRKSAQIKPGFDTQEYIEHLERELQQAKDDMFSPTTNRSLKDQLKTARHDNDKLRQDLTDMRDMFEAEVKRTIEHKAQMEVELKRRVRNLEDELQQKVCLIRDLELEHDSRRLDNNTIDALKAAIDRLEQDKLSLSEENRSVSKRNEVLSELLAMSPTKTQSFELKSPIREKRAAARPMSMIIPKLPSSPNSRQISQPSSAVVSPALSAGAPFFRHWKSDADSLRQNSQGLDNHKIDEFESDRPDLAATEGSHTQDQTSTRIRSRRSTMQSQVSFTDTASLASDSSSPVDQPSQRQYPKRKPRKFMSGSTQLKPLLLPALTNDSLPLTSPSMPPSPNNAAMRDVTYSFIGPTAHSVSEPIEDETEESTLLLTESALQDLSDLGSNSTSAVYNTFEEILAANETIGSLETASNSDSQTEPQPCLVAEGTVFDETDTFEPDGILTKECEAFMGFDRRQPHADLDLNALNDLNLPEPSFDLIPRGHPDMDDGLFTVVPQPLFSISAPINQTLQNVDYSTSFDQPTRLVPQAFPLPHRHSNRPQTRPSVFDLSPTPKSRSSWHGSTARPCSETQASRMACMEYNSRPELPQRSTLRNTESLARANGSLDMIRSGKLGAQPLAALTIRTIFGTISQCTRHVRDFKRNPLALARRLLANAWLSNWKIFGRFSWWVLGLFIQSGVGGPKLKQFDWSSYDAEEIARKACHDSPSTRPATARRHELAVESARSAQVTNNSIPPKQKPGWGQTALLWGKFSVAIMLAIGGAVTKGPGEMLKEPELPPHVETSATMSGAVSSDQRRRQGSRGTLGRPARIDDSTTAPMVQNQYGHPSISPAMRRASTSSRHSISGSVPPLRGFHGGLVEWPTFPPNSDEDATLRPAGSPRIPVAALFEREGIYRNQDPWPHPNWVPHH